MSSVQMSGFQTSHTKCLTLHGENERESFPKIVASRNFDLFKTVLNLRRSKSQFNVFHFVFSTIHTTQTLQLEGHLNPDLMVCWKTKHWCNGRLLYF